jgi:hypothetical protein
MNDWKPVVVALEYILLFDKRLLDSVDTVADTIMQQRALPFSPQEVIDALAEARQSNIDLSTLHPQPHSDAALREFFKALEVKLAELTGRQ